MPVGCSGFGAPDNDRLVKEASWLSTQSWFESLRYYPKGEDADDDDDHEGEGDDGEVEDEDFALVLPVTHVLRRRLGLGLPSCDDASMPPLEGAAADGEDEREAELASGRRPLEASTPYHVDEGGGPTPAFDSPLTIAEPELKRTRPFLGEMDLEMDEPDGGAASAAAKVAARVADAAEAMPMPMEA